MTAAAKPRIATIYYIIVDHHDDERGDESCSSSRRRGEERKKEKEGKEEGRPEVKERGKRASPPNRTVFVLVPYLLNPAPVSEIEIEIEYRV